MMRNALVSGDAAARPRVLVVDDDAMMCEAVDQVLRDMCEVITTTRPQDVPKLLADGLEVDLLVLDVQMPVMTGMELHRVLVATAPELASHTIFITGGLAIPDIAAFFDSVSNRCVDKPFTEEQLLDAVCAELEACGWTT